MEKIATEAYNTEEIKLLNGEVVVLKPLVLKQLKKFMKTMDDWTKSEDADESFELLLTAGARCFSKTNPDFWDEKEEKYTDEFEENVDIHSLYRALDVCGGVNLNDPKLQEAAQAAALAEAANGNN